MSPLRFVLLFVSCTTLFAASPDDIVGVWNTADNDGKVEIYKCGSHYCKDHRSERKGLPR